MSTLVLESKLKRHKISYTIEDGKIIIGKPKTDFATLIGLVILPFALGIGICILLILNNVEFIGANSGKIIAGLILLFGAGFFNLSRMRAKKQSNDTLKILYQNTIKIINTLGQHEFNAQNTMEFKYTAQRINEETVEGNLFVVDQNGIQHQILGFDDENEKYVDDDLKWFSAFLSEYLKLEQGTAQK